MMRIIHQNYFLIIISIITFQLIFARNLITIDKCQQCSNKKNPFKIDFSNLSFSSFNNTVSFNGTFLVLEDIHGIMNMELVSTRCTMQHKQCEKFSKLKFDDVCGNFFRNKILGDRFVSGVKPTLECPFKKGVYQTKNVVLELEFAANLPFGGWL